MIFQVQVFHSRSTSRVTFKGELGLNGFSVLFFVLIEGFSLNFVSLFKNLPLPRENYGSAAVRGKFLELAPTYTFFGYELTIQFWDAVSQFEISLLVSWNVTVCDSPGLSGISSKARRTFGGSVGPPRERYCGFC